MADVTLSQVMKQLARYGLTVEQQAHMLKLITEWVDSTLTRALRKITVE